MRSKFTTNNNVTPLQILQYLIPKKNTKFTLPLPTIKDINKIIKKAKASNSVGNDIITMRTIKKLTPLISPHLTHLLTTIITTETYPDILKTTRITPTKKPDKPTDNIDSYRPICNLSVIDKILQQYIKDNMTNYLDINDIITKDNHGSRKGHSTTTALASIQHSQRH